MEKEAAPAFFLALRHTKQAGKKGGNREGKTVCCTEEVGAHRPKASYAEATIAARR
jgi:hypothetical protein